MGHPCSVHSLKSRRRPSCRHCAAFAPRAQGFTVAVQISFRPFRIVVASVSRGSLYAHACLVRHLTRNQLCHLTTSGTENTSTPHSRVMIVAAARSVLMRVVMLSRRLRLRRHRAMPRPTKRCASSVGAAQHALHLLQVVLAIDDQDAEACAPRAREGALIDELGGRGGGRVPAHVRGPSRARLRQSVPAQSLERPPPSTRRGHGSHGARRGKGCGPPPS